MDDTQYGAPLATAGQYEPVPTTDFRRLRVSVAQAVTIARVHRNTIYNWVQSNKVEYVRTPTGALRIYADTLLRRESA